MSIEIEKLESQLCEAFYHDIIPEEIFLRQLKLILKDKKSDPINDQLNLNQMKQLSISNGIVNQFVNLLQDVVNQVKNDRTNVVNKEKEEDPNEIKNYDAAPIRAFLEYSQTIEQNFMQIDDNTQKIINDNIDSQDNEEEDTSNNSPSKKQCIYV